MRGFNDFLNGSSPFLTTLGAGALFLCKEDGSRRLLMLEVQQGWADAAQFKSGLH